MAFLAFAVGISLWAVGSESEERQRQTSPVSVPDAAFSAASLPAVPADIGREPKPVDPTASKSTEVNASGQAAESSAAPSALQSDDSAESTMSPEDAGLARRLVGNWQQDRFGQRYLSVKADGTASMTIHPASLYAFAFGSRIDIRMYWSVKDGRLDYGIKDGTPQDKVDLAAQTWGDHWVEKIESLTPSELVLIGESDGLPCRWTKTEARPVPEISAAPESR